MREIRKAGSMSGGGKRSHGRDRGTGIKAKAAGNSYSLDLQPSRPPPTLLYSRHLFVCLSGTPFAIGQRSNSSAFLRSRLVTSKPVEKSSKHSRQARAQRWLCS